MSALLLQFLPYIVGALGLAFAALKLVRFGANGERAKQQASEAKARDIADDVQNDIGAMKPEQRREALRKYARD